MTDIEMLVLAAKAVSLKHVDYSRSDYSGSLGLQLIHNVGRHTSSWNPVKDDGDAFRLAVKLNLSYSFSGEYVVVHGYGWPNLVIHRFTGEVIDAIRLAIVMAAAEIGKGM